MRTAHAADQVRAAEAPLLAALPEGALMARAAGALAVQCANLLGGVYGARVVLLVGAGNNGGDALVAGAALAGRGARVDAVLLAEEPHPAGLAALRTAGGRTRSASDTGVLARADLIVDGILGIGGRGGLRPAAAAVVDALPKGVPVVAVDVPSGVDASTGEVAGAAVRADLTVTFGALKPGLLIAPGAEHAGLIEVVDIGLDADVLGIPELEALQAVDVLERWPWPGAAGDKYARGVLGVHAGSDAYPGAGALCVAGAQGAGCGYVRSAASGKVAELVRHAHPEVIVTEVPADEPAKGVGRVQAWAVGPGIGTDDAAHAGVRSLLETELPLVLDADGLSVLLENADLLKGRGPSPVVLTPHAGELARLLDVDRGAVEARRLEHVRRAADVFGATVLLKGSTTLVAGPGSEPVRVNTTGTGWLGTAGSGDVLTGVIGTLLAAGLEAREAASVGAWVHGLAGRLASAGGPITASGLAAALPRAIAAIASPGELA